MRFHLPHKFLLWNPWPEWTVERRQSNAADGDPWLQAPARRIMGDLLAVESWGPLQDLRIVARHRVSAPMVADAVGAGDGHRAAIRAAIRYQWGNPIVRGCSEPQPMPADGEAQDLSLILKGPGLGGELRCQMVAFGMQRGPGFDGSDPCGWTPAGSILYESHPMKFLLEGTGARLNVQLVPFVEDAGKRWVVRWPTADLHDPWWAVELVGDQNDPVVQRVFGHLQSPDREMPDSDAAVMAEIFHDFWFTLLCQAQLDGPLNEVLGEFANPPDGETREIGHLLHRVARDFGLLDAGGVADMSAELRKRIPRYLRP